MLDIDQLYGRQSTLALLRRRIVDLKEGYRHNIAFLGDRHVGKTMIVQKFLEDLEDPLLMRIYLDLENRDFQYFYHKFVGGLLYEFVCSKNLPVSDDLKFLVEAATPHIPQTVKQIRRAQVHLSQGRVLESYREIISLPQLFTKESGLFCLLILDEFQHLDELGIPEVFQELGKAIMTQKKSLYVILSSQPVYAHEILSEKLALLFGNFEIVQVGPFDLKTSQEFIRHQLGNVAVGEGLKNFLVDFSGGFPLYMQLLCQELVNLAAVYKQQEVFTPLFKLALENALFHPWGVLSRHFDLTIERLCTGKSNAALAEILMILSDGKRKLADVSAQLELKQNIVNQRLNRLIDLGVVAKSGNVFYLRDKLLRYWVKYVYQKRRKALHFDAQQCREQFRVEIDAAIENFHLHTQKDFSSRIAELLYCFENDAYVINGRRYKLPLFQDVTTWKFRKNSGESMDVLKAKTDEGDWLVALAPGAVNENDIQALVKECKRLEQKPQRCILVALNPLDENTRLKALHERMWIWHEGELNVMLNMFGKPYLIRTTELPFVAQPVIEAGVGERMIYGG